jgi:hypothetical protein
MIKSVVGSGRYLVADQLAAVREAEEKLRVITLLVQT